jgi:hypothetical protein
MQALPQRNGSAGEEPRQVGPVALNAGAELHGGTVHPIIIVYMQGSGRVRH